VRTDDVIETLPRDVMAGLGQDAETASTLPPAAYTSQGFFDLEMAKIFRHEAPDKSRWVRHVLVSPESKALPDFAELVERPRTSGLNITAEDVAVNTLQQLGAASSYAWAGRLCHLEKPVWQRADYIRRRIAS
jgi:hypothetical protein